MTTSVNQFWNFQLLDSCWKSMFSRQVDFENRWSFGWSSLTLATILSRKAIPMLENI